MMVIVGLALIGALIVAGVFTVVRYTLTRAQRQTEPFADILPWSLSILVANFVLALLILYFGMPALTGPYNGWEWLAWPMLITAVVVIFSSNTGGLMLASILEPGRVADRFAPRPGARRPGLPASRGSVVASGVFVVGLVLLTSIVINGIIVVATTWFDPNAKALAAIARVEAQSPSAPLPPTDVNHIVLVTQGVAAYLGQQVVASSGQNLGSIYHADPAGYTLQSVNHHLYWIAPLIYNNVFANLSHQDSPAYVVVDAEDPDVQATLRTGFHMRYLPGALLNQDLMRHVYLSGYTYGNLMDPTFEVRDDWRPFFTISLMQPTRGFTGNVLRSVLVVDAQTGAITAYAPDRAPTWIDRVIPADTVTQYLTWWGKYLTAPWFNPSGSGQQIPSNSTPQLVYNNADVPVWLDPMTSSSGSDSSSTGVVLYDTHDNRGKFYPLGGLGVTNNVESTFKGNPHNLRGYDVGAVQLYQIFGVPTWVAVFVQNNSSGELYQAVGMVDARHLIGSNVIMAPTKAEALADYAQSLGTTGVTGGPTSSGQQVHVKGKITRISSALDNNTSVYYILISGQTRIFQAALSLSAELPLMREGDTVEGTYIDTGRSVVTLTALNDLDIQLATPPAATSTP
ncbi:MAG TPA: hypothetical protein VGR57_15595 [Ktedonobacterales bacterium]|nr:hypothetical protein [Ktedonobacterales bacterium]